MFKKILKYLAVVIALLAVIASLLVFAYSEKIEKKVISELSKQIAVDVKVSAYHVTLWRSFPNIGIRLDNVRIEESYPVFNLPFIEAERLYFQFNLIQVLKGEYSLRKLQLYDGICRLGVLEEGENYHFLKSSDSDSSEDFELNLNSINIQNTVFHFIGKDSNELHFDFNRIKAKGKISSDRISFNAFAKGDCNKVLIGETNWPLNRAFSLDAAFDYDFTKDKLKIDQGDLKIGASSFDTKGYFIFKERDSVNLLIRTEGNQISSLVGLLPTKLNNQFKDYDSEGFFAASVYIKGEMEQDNPPDMEAVIQIENGYINASDDLSPMESIYLDARLLYSKNKKQLRVSNLSLIWDKQPIQAEFVLNDFSNPEIAGVFKGNLNLEQIDRFFNIEDWVLAGKIEANLSIKGKLKDFANNRFYHQTGFKGQMNWANLKISHINPEIFPYKISKTNGEWYFDNNFVSTKNLRCDINESQIAIVISSGGLFKWMMEEGELNLNTNITGNHFELIPLGSSEDKNKKTEKSKTNTLLQRIDFQTEAVLEKFVYDKMKISGFRLQANYSKEFLEVKNLSGRMAEGMISFTGTVHKMDLDDNRWIIRAGIEGSQLNIKTFFESFRNFGQEEITSENLSGRLTFETQLAMIIQSDLNWKKEDLYCFTSIKIDNGQLLNYEPMQKLSDYAEVDELKNIRFSSITNTFEVKDGEINFPYMNIGNNILNMRIKGKHMFDNYLDYTIRVLVSDGLAAKYNLRKNRNPDELEDLKENGVALYINMKGYPDNLKFSFQKIGGKPELVQQFGEEWKSGRKDMKETIKEEFTKEGRTERDIKKAEKEEVEWEE